MTKDSLNPLLMEPAAAVAATAAAPESAAAAVASLVIAAVIGVSLAHLQWQQVVLCAKLLALVSYPT